jgi:hypothetical protein
LNWESWSEEIEAILEHHDLWSCVENNELFAQKDKKTRELIILNVNTDIKGQVKSFKTAKESGLILQDNMKVKPVINCVYWCKKLANLENESNSLSDVANAFPKLRDEYKQLPKDDDTLLKAFLFHLI